MSFNLGEMLLKKKNGSSADFEEDVIENTEEEFEDPEDIKESDSKKKFKVPPFKGFGSNPFLEFLKRNKIFTIIALIIIILMIYVKINPSTVNDAVDSSKDIIETTTEQVEDITTEEEKVEIVDDKISSQGENEDTGIDNEDVLYNYGNE